MNDEKQVPFMFSDPSQNYRTSSALSALCKKKKKAEWL